MKLLRKLRALFRQKSLDAEMAEEMREHLERRTEANLAAGMSAEEARYAAQRQFGGVEQLKEVAREQRSGRWIEDVGRDVLFALRMLRKQPGFTVAAVLTLALGIGFVATLGTIVNGIAYRGLPFEDAAQIVSIGVSSDRLAEVARQQTSCSVLSLVRSAPLNLSGNVVLSRQAGAYVSTNLFELLRVPVMRGRGLQAGDGRAGAPKVALIAEALWRQDFNGDASAVGREIKINGEIHTVVGVMPVGFGFPRNETIWVALPENERTRDALVVGRLNPGISVRRAAEEFSLINARIVLDTAGRVVDGAENTTEVEVIPFAERSIKGVVRNLLTGILGATFLVLLLACANVANLILVRASERSRELALRSALGATRGRLILQMLVESVVLSVLGAAVGLAAAYGGTALIWNYVTRETALTGGAPFWVNFKMDGTVLVFVAGTTLVASVLTGLVPALRSSRVDVNEQLKAGGGIGRVSRLTRVLVNVQMALSVGLVVAAGLFLTLLIEFNQKQLPYNPAQVLTARLSLNEKDYPTAARRNALVDELLARFAADPAITSSAATSAESLRAAGRQIEIEGETYARPSQKPGVLAESVSPNYFETLQLAVREGRVFRVTDTSDTPAVAVVNPAFVEKFVRGGGGAVGRRFRMATPDNSGAWIAIAGVVDDAGSLKAAQKTDGPRFYRPLAQEPASAVTLLARAQRGEGGALADSLRRMTAARDPELPLNQVHTVQDVIEMERIGINLPGLLLVLCGVGALALASVGVYGVVAFSVKSRTREFGVRLALGCSPREIVSLVVKSGLKEIAVGLGAGVVLALGASVMLSSMFVSFGRSAYDLWIYAAVVALLTGVALLALLIPARRAAKVDPMVALRTE